MLAGGTTVIGPRVAWRVGPRLGPAVSPIDDELSTSQLQQIVLVPPAPSISLLTNLQMVARGVYNDGRILDITTHVTWSSTNPLIASVSNILGSIGLVAALLVGTTQISATLGPITGVATLQVTL